MGIFDRMLSVVGLVRRSVVPSEFLIGARNGVRSAAGALVDVNAAMKSAPFKQGIRLVSSTIGSLPLFLYEYSAGNDNTSKLTSDVRYRLLHSRPNRRMTSFVFRRTLQALVMTQGNAYAEVIRAPDMSPVSLELLPAGGTKPVRVLEDGSLLYSVTRAGGRVADELHGDNVLHLSGLGFDGLQGRDEVQDASETLGLNIASEQFASTFYGNGATLGGILKTDQAIDKETAKAYAEQFNANHQGSAKAHGVSVTGHGLEYKPVGVEPEKGQMLESRKFQVLETARQMGVQPHLLFDLERATFSNIEQQSLEFVIYTLLPVLVMWEQELNRKLLTPAEEGKRFFGFKVDALLRGDQASRYAGYAIGRQWGFLSVNDIRRLEDMNPIGPAGDQYLVPANMGDSASAGGKSFHGLASVGGL